MNAFLASHYINGRWIEGQGPRFQSINPATLEPLWQGHKASREEAQSAIKAAKDATAGWARASLNERINVLRVFSETLTTNQDELTRLISNESGKPLWEAKTEAQAVIAKINISIRAYEERTQDTWIEEPQSKTGVTYKPHGVMVVLGPFNFPAHLSNGHIVPALLAGNTIVYKPSELTPGVAAFITECWNKSGLPAGVFNLVQGDAECAEWLLEEDIQGVLFTGSYRAGLQIHQRFSSRPEVILALEMGGNNPLIIDHLNDIPAAVYQTILSSFITAGQRCSCARRVFIPNDAFGENFLEALQAATRSLVIGAPEDSPEPFLGPVIRPLHAEAHLRAQHQLIQQGARPIQPMTSLRPKFPFLTPGIIDMTEVLSPPDEEIFAPLIQLYRYEHFEEAISGANATRYGLTAGLLSDNREHYDIFYANIRAGLLYWNRATTGASSQLPFGGLGQSGNHRPSAFFAADYCAYPIANMTQSTVTRPATLLPGIRV